MDTGRKLLEQAREALHALYEESKWTVSLGCKSMRNVQTIIAAIDHLKGEPEALQAGETFTYDDMIAYGRLCWRQSRQTWPSDVEPMPAISARFDPISPQATAQPAEPAQQPLSTITSLKRERDGWQEEAANLAKRLRFAQCDLDAMRSHQKNEVWYWQGDGYDHLESMGRDMVVVIHAGDLRALAATPPTPAEPSADSLWNNSAVMALNAELGLTMDQLLKLARALASLTPPAQAKGGE